MDLYRFEVVTKEQGVFPVVIVAKSDDHAFELVEIEVEKYFIKKPKLLDITLYEKKKPRGGNGFVLYEQENLV